MKRHPGLRRLSQDHQHGLVQARHLQQAGSPNAPGHAAAVAAAFLHAWAAEIHPHFRAEEAELLPAFARYGDPGQPLIVRMLVEHGEIRRVDDLARELAGGPPDLATLVALGALLYAHIRYEEAVVFPLVEAAQVELATLLARAAGAAGGRGAPAPG